MSEPQQNVQGIKMAAKKAVTILNLVMPTKCSLQDYQYFL